MLSPTTPLKLSVSQSQTSLLYSSPSPPYSPSNPLFSYKNSKPNMCCWKTRAVYYFFIPAKMIQSRLANSLRRCGFDKRNAIWRAAEGKQSGIYLSAAEAVPYILAIHFFFFLHHADTICCVTLCVCVCEGISISSTPKRLFMSHRISLRLSFPRIKCMNNLHISLDSSDSLVVTS